MTGFNPNFAASASRMIRVAHGAQLTRQPDLAEARHRPLAIS